MSDGGGGYFDIDYEDEREEKNNEPSLPLEDSDPVGGTVAEGISFYAAFGIAFSLEMHVIQDKQGNMALEISFGFGGGTPAAAASSSTQLTNANSIEDLSGWGVEAGGSYFLLV